MPSTTNKRVEFRYNGAAKQTVATLSTAELEALRNRTLPQVVMLNDMDDVHNIKFLGNSGPLISRAALKRLIQWGCCFDGGGHQITDDDIPADAHAFEAFLEQIKFNIFQRPLQEHLGSIFKKLRLLPVVGTQRLAVSNREVIPVGPGDIPRELPPGEEPRAGVERWLEPFENRLVANLMYPQAKRAAKNCASIPAFGYFSEQHIESIHGLIFKELSRRFFKDIGGIPAYLKLAEGTYDITQEFFNGSLQYQYVNAALACHGKLLKMLDPEEYRYIENNCSAIIEAVRKLDLLKIQLSTGYSLDLMPPDADPDELTEGKIYLEWESNQSIKYAIVRNDEIQQGSINVANFPQLANHIRNPLRLPELERLLPQILKILSDKGDCRLKATMAVPDFSAAVNSLTAPEGVTPENLLAFKQQVLAHMAVQPTFIDCNPGEEPQLMLQLYEAYQSIQRFATDAVGETSRTYTFIEHIIAEGALSGDLHYLRENYIKWARNYEHNYQTDELAYFKALWNLYVDHVQASYDAINDIYLLNGESSPLDGNTIPDINIKIAVLKRDHNNVLKESAEQIEGKFDLTKMQNFLRGLFETFSMQLTNGSKVIIGDEIVKYLRSIGERVSDGCTLKDDRKHYGLTFVRKDQSSSESAANPNRAFIHADKSKLFATYARTRNVAVELDAMIDPGMVESEIEELSSLRPPLIVLALLAIELVPEDAGRPDLADEPRSALRDHKKKMAVNLVDHALLDAAIVACLVSDTENLAAFKSSILNCLVEQAKQLTTDANPIAYNRFAAQFFNFMASNLTRLPPLARDMLQQARIIAPNLNPAFLLARLLKAICSDIKAFYQTPVNDALVPDFEPSPEVETALKKVAESLGMIGLDAYAGRENVLSAYGAYEKTDEQKTLMSHMKTMIDLNALGKIERALPGEQDERPAQAAATAPTDMSARAATNTETAFNVDGSGDFTFQANTEVHVISHTAPASADSDLVQVVVRDGVGAEQTPEELFARMQRIFDQLFRIVDGQIERLAGHEFFMTQTVGGNVTTVTVHAVVNAKGLVVFNKGNGELSTHIGDPINGSVATAVITRGGSHASVTITLPSSMGFCSDDNKEYSIHDLLIGHDQAVNLNHRLGKPEKIYPLIEAQAETMHQLGEVFQAEYYVMARILYQYLRDNKSVDAGSALDACRILAYLQAQNKRFSPGGDLHAIAEDLKELEKQVLTLRDLDSSPAYHRQRLQNIALGTFAVAETVGLMGATAFKQTVDDPLFLLQYKQEVVDIFQQYVFPALRATVAYDYGLGLFVIGAALFSIPRLYRRVRASATEVSMRRMLPNSSELGIFERITGYFGSAPAAATVSQRAKEQLLKMSEEFQRNMGSVPGDWQVYKKVSARNLRQQHFTVPYSPREQSVINGTILAKEILAPFSIAAVLPPLIQGLSKLNDPDVTDFAVSNILKVVMEEAVLAAGQYGFSFILPLILLLYFLPESALVDMWRVISNNMMTPLRTLCCSGNDDSDEGESEDDTLVEVVSRGVEGSGGVASGMQQQSSQRQRAPSGSPSMYGGSSLKQRLLSEHSRDDNLLRPRFTSGGGEG